METMYSWLPLEDKRILLTVRTDGSSREAFENGVDAQTEIVDTGELGQLAEDGSIGDHLR